MLNTLTGPVVCTIVWGVIGLIIFWICDIPRTMKKLSWFSVVCESHLLNNSYALAGAILGVTEVSRVLRPIHDNADGPLILSVY